MQQFSHIQHIIRNIAADLSLIAKLMILMCVLLSAPVFIVSDAHSYGVTPGGTSIDDCTGPNGKGGIVRQTCNDLADLPLCSTIEYFRTNEDSSSRPPLPLDPSKPLTSPYTSGINCVRECSAPEFENTKPAGGVRGVDYAVHNKHCIRFCDAKESGVSSASPSPNCTARKCHQLPYTASAAQFSACNAVKCSLLSKEELAHDFANKMGKDDKKYCELDRKCYEFSQDKLPYVRYRLQNSTCQMHQCEATTCGLGANDALKVQQQSGGAAYVDEYKKYIDPGYGLTKTITDSNGLEKEISRSICRPLNCLPIALRKSPCKLPLVGGFKSTPDAALCDPSSICDEGYCTKEINCNITSNLSENECATTTNTSNESTFDNASEDFKLRSWFYRPEPLGRAKSGDKIRDNIRVSDGDICYNRDDLEDNDWGERWQLGLLDMGFFHYIWDNERSPGHCGASKTGMRGPGYAYLCGTEMSVYEDTSPDVGYIDGYAAANYTLPDPEYKIKACLRYGNTLRLGACGRRTCGIFCEFNACRTQMCGWDMCRTLTVKHSNPKSCADPFNSGGACDSEMGGGASMDSYLRLRVVKYGRSLCPFLDHKGLTGYDNSYMNGEEELDDGTCIVGIKDDAGVCNGRNSNGDAGSSEEADPRLFRTERLIRYSYSANPIDVNGRKIAYEDADGKLYPQQECAYIPLRKGPPKLYTIANRRNSERLFAPPLYISEVKVVKGGARAADQKTDFHYPEIEVTFGSSKALLSLEKDEIGGLVTINPPAYSEALLSVSIGARPYDAKVYIQKEFNIITNKPVICLYRDQTVDGNRIKSQLACVDRRKPEIDAFVGTYKRKALVSAPSANTFKNATLELKLMISAGTDTIDNNCTGDDECSPTISFANPSSKDASCQKGIEGYDFCAQKESCSELFDECVQNEIELAGLSTGNAGYKSKLGIKEQCDNVLLPSCNVLWGIVPGTVTDVGQLIRNMPTNSLRPSAANVNAYGWFNEICVTRGFEDKLVNILTHRVNEGKIKGKCLIDATIPGVNASLCGDGGNAALNCPCQKVGTSTLANLNKSEVDYQIRKQTFREAGLCINVPYPKMCPDIKYEGDPITSFYAENGTWNYGFSRYETNSQSGLHQSHKDRTDNAIAASQHAEFGATFSGANDLEGECRGFWKGQDKPSGATANPLMSCKLDGTWDTTGMNNGCVRYVCPKLDAGNGKYYRSGEENKDTDNTELYPGNYGDGPDNNIADALHGYANWNEFTKTNDFIEAGTFAGCIPGYEKDGTKTPYRNCTQHGNWTTAGNPCKRIACPAINKTNQDSISVTDWYRFGGAHFDEGKASKSDLIIIGDETTKYGTCYDNTTTIRFFQEGDAPKMTCNHLGQWSDVENPCTTSCKATDIASSNSGFAYWKEATNIPLNGEGPGVIDRNKGNDGCLIGYKYNPYTFPYTSEKNAYPNIHGQSLPTRVCEALPESTASRFLKAKNPCVNYCPGKDDDPREGVGITTLPSSSGSIAIQWPRANFNDVKYVSSTSNLNAANFVARSAGAYLLKRECGADGIWKAPVPLCATDSGDISNATYDLNLSVTGNDDHVVAGDPMGIPGTCKYGYRNGTIQESYDCGNWAYSKTCYRDIEGPAPIKQCAYASGNTNIDQVYLKPKPGSKECEEVVCLVNGGDRIKVGSYNTKDTMKTPGVKNTTRRFCTKDNLSDCWEETFTALNGGSTPTSTLKRYEKNGSTGDIDWGSETIIYDNVSDSGMSRDINVLYRDSSTSKKIDETVPVTCEEGFIQTGSNALMTCQRDGTWGILNDSCRRGKSCTLEKQSYHYDAVGCGNGSNMSIGPLYNIRHGQTISYTPYDACDGCHNEEFAFKCNDGAWTSYRPPLSLKFKDTRGWTSWGSDVYDNALLRGDKSNNYRSEGRWSPGCAFFYYDFNQDQWALAGTSDGMEGTTDLDVHSSGFMLYNPDTGAGASGGGDWLSHYYDYQDRWIHYGYN